MVRQPRRPRAGSHHVAHARCRVCKPDSAKRVIAVYEEFCTIPDINISKGSKLKTLIHECTHYVDTFDSLDVMYGTGTGISIWAKMHSDQTSRNADNITCYIAC